MGQGASQSMPWLRDLVENNDSSFEDLPVQCGLYYIMRYYSSCGIDSHVVLLIMWYYLILMQYYSSCGIGFYVVLLIMWY